MKHSEFKRRVEELGFRVGEKRSGIKITHGDGQIAWVSNRHESVMDNFCAIPLSTEVRETLFDILVEYARTPIEDREDEKRYSIHPIRTRDEKLIRFDATFRKCGYVNERSFEIGNFGRCTRTNTTAFLEDDAREICDFFGWDFDKVAVEVKDDE